MSTYQLFTDSASDIPEERAAEWGVRIIPISSQIAVDNGQELHGESIPVEEFYALMRSKYISRTSAINIGEFLAAFEPVLAGGDDILYIAFSSGLSTTCHTAILAAEELKKKYPDRTVRVVDSLCASFGQGLLVYYAAMKKNLDAALEEVAAFAEEQRLHLCHEFTVDDLFFLKRGGRVSTAKAIVGSMLQIKPVLHVDNAGKLIMIGKARGRRASVQTLLDAMRRHIEHPEDQVIFISHGDCAEDAQRLADMVREAFPVKDVLITFIGPVIGAHSGPGTVALFYLGGGRE